MRFCCASSHCHWLPSGDGRFLIFRSLLPLSRHTWILGLGCCVGSQTGSAYHPHPGRAHPNASSSTLRRGTSHLPNIGVATALDMLDLGDGRPVGLLVASASFVSMPVATVLAKYHLATSPKLSNKAVRTHTRISLVFAENCGCIQAQAATFHTSESFGQGLCMP